MTDDEKIKRALEIAKRYSRIDGDHHKTWVIDQMVRVLLGSPRVIRRGISEMGVVYDFEEVLESHEYIEWVKEFQIGDDGPVTYVWDKGIAP